MSILTDIVEWLDGGYYHNESATAIIHNYWSLIVKNECGSKYMAALNVSLCFNLMPGLREVYKRPCWP
jgi:hypothetical protein